MPFVASVSRDNITKNGTFIHVPEVGKYDLMSYLPGLFDLPDNKAFTIDPSIVIEKDSSSYKQKLPQLALNGSAKNSRIQVEVDAETNYTSYFIIKRQIDTEKLNEEIAKVENEEASDELVLVKDGRLTLIELPSLTNRGAWAIENSYNQYDRFTYPSYYHFVCTSPSAPNTPFEKIGSKITSIDNTQNNPLWNIANSYKVNDRFKYESISIFVCMNDIEADTPFEAIGGKVRLIWKGTIDFATTNLVNPPTTKETFPDRLLSFAANF